MEEAQESHLEIPMIEENEGAYSNTNINSPYRAWLQIAIYSLMILFGQSAATLLGRLYYEKGGNSMWMAALVQSAGFPIILPLLFLTSQKKKLHPIHQTNPFMNSYSHFILPSLYVGFGILLAAVCILFAIGLMYLPVSTYSLICAGQLGFTVFFSYFINSQKITPFIIISVLLLTVSSVFLVFQTNGSDSSVEGREYLWGFISTVGGAAGYALLLSLQEWAYGKAFTRQTIREFLNAIFYVSMVTTCLLLVFLFVSGDWRNLRKEMEGFGLGEKSYVMVLVSAAVAWQVFAVGMIALILKISALFANVISAVNVPVVPILAVVVFHDEMSGMKGLALVLAVCGSVFYLYQKYLDHVKSKAEKDDGSLGDGEISP